MNEAKISKTPIYFSSGLGLNAVKAKTFIGISPKADNWNDFGLKTFFKLRYVENSITTFRTDIRLGFIADKEELKPFFKKWNTLARPLSEEESPQFFTMLPDMEQYRRFRVHFGDATELVLNKLNDLVYLNSLSTQPNWFNDAIETDYFTYSFMRETQTFFAFHNAQSIIYGIDNEKISEISSDFTVKFKLPNCVNYHKVNLTFDRSHILSKNISLLIGLNGLGKSQTLNHLVKYALEGNTKLLHSQGERVLFNNIIAIGTPGETQQTFPKESKKARIPYKRISIDRKKGRGTQGISSLLIQLARSNETIVKNSRWTLFIKAIEPIFNLPELHLPIKEQWTKEYAETIEISKLARSGEQNSLERYSRVDASRDPVRVIDKVSYPLSSGELAFLNFAAQICLHIENGSLVLLDEPETHLHPNLITNLVNILQRLLKLTGSISIIATHSVYFVRELPRSQVLVYSRNESGNISVDHPRLKTLGADIGAISQFIFNDDPSPKILLDLKKKLMKNLDTVDTQLAELKDELSSEAIVILKSNLAESA